MDYRRRNSKSRALLGFVIVFALVIFAVVAYALLHNPTAKDAYNVVSMPEIEGMDSLATYGRITGEAWSGKLNDPFEFSYRINSQPKLPSGDKVGTIMFENSQSNTHYMAVELIMDDEQLVYRSGIIPPGYFVGSAKLDKELIDGVYDATMVISVIDPVDLIVLEAFEENVTITVGKQ